MQIAVKMSVAPRSSRRRPRRDGLIHDGARIYELGVESWRTSVDEIVEGVMTPRPGISGNSGEDA
jgi:hypothetical protein